jgi:NAD-dependent SIR2 family protein deacetylase
MRRDVVLFLGAGFSCGLGLPTMNQFGQASLIEKENLGQENEGKKPDVTLFRNAAEKFIEFQEYCKKAKPFIRINTDNMEELFCLAEIYRVIKEKDVPGINYSFGDPLSNIKWWLWKIFHQLTPFTQKENNKGIKFLDIYKDIYKPFAKYLKSFKSSFSVITTNYDMIFEYLAFDQGFKCCYPFIKQYEKLPGKNGEYNSFVFTNYKVDSPVICKLHGSTNYFKYKDPSRKLKFGISDDIASKNSGYSNIPKDKKMPAILRLNGLSEIERINDIGFLVPEIVPPTYEKLINEDWLKETWERAFRLIRNARKIIFIGYSLPESDGFMPSMIRAAMASRRKKEKLKIVVIDPSPDTFCRYSRLFGCLSSDLKFYNSTFSEFVKSVMN